MSSKPKAPKLTLSTIVWFEVVLFILAVLGIRWTSVTAGDIDDRTGLYALAGVALGAMTYGLTVILYRSIHSYSAPLREMIAQVRSAVERFGLTAILIIAACAAIGEEMLFRVFLQNWISEFIPLWLAVLVASILFAAMHAISWMYFAITLVLGYLIGWLFAYTESIALVVAWHFSYDFLALLVVTRYPGLLFLCTESDPVASNVRDEACR